MWERNGVPVDNFSQRVSVDSATIKGFELGGRVPLFEGWSFNANYADRQRGHVRRQAGPAAGIAAAPCLEPGPEVAGQRQVQHLGARRIPRQAVQRHELGKEQVFYSPYWLASLGGSYAVSKNVTLSASVYNLFDKNFENYGPTKTGASAPTAATNWSNSYRQVLEGRRLWVSANITF